jgi:hypothetical protein
MLETSQERIKLLKAGFTGNTIEELYIECNNFRIERNPIVVELIELDSPNNKTGIPELTTRCAQ